MPSKLDSSKGNRPAPTTLDYLEVHALRQPDRVALRTEATVASYARLHADVCKVAEELRGIGLQPGSVVAVGIPDTYRHWLVLLACEGLGWATCSFNRQEWLSLRYLFERVDAVLADAPINDAGANFRLLNADWFERALGAPRVPALPDGPASHPADLPMRLIRSSGSTADPKLIMLNRAHVDMRCVELMMRGGLGQKSVELSTGPLALTWTYLRALCCLRLGAHVVAMPAVAGLQAAPVTDLQALPLVLSELLGGLPADWRKRPGVRLRVGGGALSPGQRARALELLCDELDVAYGTNEVGGICFQDERRCGILHPGVEVRIVDEAGRQLPMGAEGELLIRTHTMVSEYWGQPEATAAHFRAGWFVPGDLARLVSYRQLQLIGRADDMLNIGGIKRAPGVIEDAFRQLDSVREVLVGGWQRADGTEFAAALVALHEGASLTAVTRQVGRFLPAWAMGMPVRQVQELPRLPSGKTDRRAIRGLFSPSPLEARES